MKNNFLKSNSTSFKKSAMTLAEVLITLLIIGVVAAILIPPLNNKIQDMEFKNAAKEAYSKASQAVQQMKQDQGGSLAYYYTTAGSFKPVFMTYFKVIQDCNIRDCVPYSTTSDTYTNLSGDKASTYFFYNGQFVTVDGMFFAIRNNNDTGGIVVIVDVNGYEKKPNVFGKDTFAFQLLNDNLMPMGTNGTIYYSSNNTYCNNAIHDSDHVQGLACMVNVMQGINY